MAKEYLGRNSNSTNQNDTDEDDYSAYDPVTAITSEDITERTSPSEHVVSAHRQRYNGEWKDKKAYTRVKNSNE